MQKSLVYKYFNMCSLIILVSIFTIGAALLIFASHYFKMDKYDLLERNAQQAAKFTVGMYEQGNEVLYGELVLDGYSLFSQSIGADIFFTDLKGETLLCTHGAPCNHTANLVPREIIAQAVRGDYRETGKLAGIYTTPQYTVGTPVITSGGTILGIVFASTSAQALNDFLLQISRMFLFTALIVIVVAFVVIYFITSGLVRPLREMVRATQSFSKGDFTVRVPVGENDEIGKLAIAFNNMASSLATTESARRSFVANVSHELKTPMTTIGGFIDGILDGTIPPEKEAQYLTIVSDEVKRLSRLVRSMLNISRIEAGEMKITPSVFDINDIICQTVFTFEQSIEAKHLEILGLDSGKVMVQADVDLIHQVVYNLVENAVKFVNDGGYLQFHYRTENGMTYVSIKNSGAGIAKDELPKIFERFYKSDKSRSMDKNGVGLGLHIVRSIVNLHQGEITVSSVEGEYCEFIFSLPAYSAKNSQSLLTKPEKIK